MPEQQNNNRRRTGASGANKRYSRFGKRRGRGGQNYRRQNGSPRLNAGEYSEQCEALLPAYCQKVLSLRFAVQPLEYLPSWGEVSRFIRRIEGVVPVEEAPNELFRYYNPNTGAEAFFRGYRPHEADEFGVAFEMALPCPQCLAYELLPLALQLAREFSFTVKYYPQASAEELAEAPVSEAAELSKAGDLPQEAETLVTEPVGEPKVQDEPEEAGAKNLAASSLVEEVQVVEPLVEAAEVELTEESDKLAEEAAAAGSETETESTAEADECLLANDEAEDGEALEEEASEATVEIPAVSAACSLDNISLGYSAVPAFVGNEIKLEDVLEVWRSASVAVREALSAQGQVFPKIRRADVDSVWEFSILREEILGRHRQSECQIPVVDFVKRRRTGEVLRMCHWDGFSQVIFPPVDLICLDNPPKPLRNGRIINAQEFFTASKEWVKTLAVPVVHKYFADTASEEFVAAVKPLRGTMLVSYDPVNFVDLDDQ